MTDKFSLDDDDLIFDDEAARLESLMIEITAAASKGVQQAASPIHASHQATQNQIQRLSEQVAALRSAEARLEKANNTILLDTIWKGTVAVFAACILAVAAAFAIKIAKAPKVETLYFVCTNYDKAKGQCREDWEQRVSKS